MENTLDLYITKLCNLRCEYCYVDIWRDHVQFDVEAFLHGICIENFDHIKFFWWEPLLKWDELTQIVRYIRNKKTRMKFTIVSNWLLLTQEKFGFIRQHAINLVVSVHATPWLAYLSWVLQRALTYDEIWTITFSFVIQPMCISWLLQEITHLICIGGIHLIVLPDSSVLWEGRLYDMLRFFVHQILEMHQKNRDIDFRLAFSGTLSDPRLACKKTIYENMDIAVCNRFKKKNVLGDEFFDMLETSLERVGFFREPDRYFFTCPIGYFLDHHGTDYDRIAGSFLQTNKLLIAAQRSIENHTAWKISFLTIQHHSEIRLNLTDQCNLRCTYCYVDFQNVVLPLGKTFSIIDYCFDSGKIPDVFSFFGWEPLLEFKQCQKIISYIQKKCQEYQLPYPKFKIATNAILMQKEHLNYFAHESIEVHITFGGLPHIHNTLRDQSWNILEKKIHTILDALWYNIVFLLMIHPESVDQLSASYLFLRSRWVSRIHLEAIYAITWKIFWSPSKIQILIKQLRIIAYIESTRGAVIDREMFQKNRSIYDISTTGQISSHSFWHFHSQYDLNFKKNFDTIIHLILFRL